MTRRLLRALQLGSLGAACSIIVLTAAPRVLYAHGPLHDQIETLSRQITDQPQNARLHLRRGELYRLDGRISAAEADYDRAARLEPELHEVHLARARLWLDDGRPAEALAQVDAFLACEPDRAEAFLVRARALAALQRVGDAIAEMDRAITHAASPRPAHYLERARLIVESGGVLQRAAAGTSAEASAGPRDAAGGNDAVDRAIRGLDEGITRLGPVVTLQWYAIDLETERERYDAALARLDRIAVQYTRKEMLLKRCGELLESAGRLLEAQAAYTDALDAVMVLPERVRDTRSIVDLQAFLRKKLKSETPERSGAP
jgi:tetratricopeptide (TPR) repeat protein